MNPPDAANPSHKGLKFDHISDYIIFENEEIIAINKPVGLLSIPDGYNPTIPNLRDILRDYFGNIWVVHRLDKDTSGIIIFAKNPEIHKLLNMQFFHRKITKKYIALIHGNPFWDRKVIDYPLCINGDRRHRTIIDQNSGKSARTIIEKIIQENNYFFAQIYPKTGLTHQIRSHLSHIGHPIIGDKLYDRQRSKNKFGKIVVPYCENGLYLHALELHFEDESMNIPRVSTKVPERFLSFNI